MREWALVAAGCATSTTDRLRLPPLQTVAQVDPYAVVGHPDRDYLWIFARTPTMSEATFQGIVERLKAKGYETSRLVRTLQVAGPRHDASTAPTGERN